MRKMTWEEMQATYPWERLYGAFSGRPLSMQTFNITGSASQTLTVPGQASSAVLYVIGAALAFTFDGSIPSYEANEMLGDGSRLIITTRESLLGLTFASSGGSVYKAFCTYYD